VSRDREEPRGSWRDRDCNAELRIVSQISLNQKIIIATHGNTILSIRGWRA